MDDQQALSWSLEGRVGALGEEEKALHMQALYRRINFAEAQGDTLAESIMDEGAQAAANGDRITDCDYAHGSRARDLWEKGWHQAHSGPDEEGTEGTAQEDGPFILGGGERGLALKRTKNDGHYGSRMAAAEFKIQPGVALVGVKALNEIIQTWEAYDKAIQVSLTASMRVAQEEQREAGRRAVLSGELKLSEAGYGMYRTCRGEDDEDLVAFKEAHPELVRLIEVKEEPREETDDLPGRPGVYLIPYMAELDEDVRRKEMIRLRSEAATAMGQVEDLEERLRAWPGELERNKTPWAPGERPVPEDDEDGDSEPYDY